MYSDQEIYDMTEQEITNLLKRIFGIHSYELEKNTLSKDKKVLHTPLRSNSCNGCFGAANNDCQHCQRSNILSSDSQLDEDRNKIEEFIDNYSSWDIWLDIRETGERYYRYDIGNRALIIKVSLCSVSDSEVQSTNEKRECRTVCGLPEYYLLEPGKHFKECKTYKSNLIDFVQKMMIFYRIDAAEGNRK